MSALPINKAAQFNWPILEVNLASFITRVELHSAVIADYERLHAAMASVGFRRVIKGSDGIWYELPWAEYSFEGQATIDQVRNAADAAASKTGKAHAVLVSEYVRCSWSGLKRASAQTA